MMNRAHPHIWHFFSNPVTLSSLNFVADILLMGFRAKGPDTASLTDGKDIDSRSCQGQERLSNDPL
jgi:hypothetical protein